MSPAPAHIEDLDPPIRGLILDVDGVLWKDAEPIGDLAAVFSAIQARSLRVSIATNNAMHSVDHYRQKLLGFGVTVDDTQIVTSAEATADTLLTAFPGRGAIYLVGEQGVMHALQDRGFEVISDPAVEAGYIAVVAGIDHGLTYDRMCKASALIRAGLPFYGTNPDPTFPTPTGLIPGAGAVIVAIATAAGRQPIIIGKPSPLILETAAGRMHLPASDLLVVGDRLETDIKGGQAFHARTALVLTGVSSRADAEVWRPAPTIIAPSLSALLGV